MAEEFAVRWGEDDVLKAVGELYLRTKVQEKTIQLLDARRLALERGAAGPAEVPEEAPVTANGPSLCQ